MNSSDAPGRSPGRRPTAGTLAQRNGLSRPAGTATTARIGLGLAAVGRPAYITPNRGADLPADRSPAALRGHLHDLLDAAYAQGVRYVDTARSYGRAEEFLADWLHRRPEHDDVVIGSKWGYTYTADWQAGAPVHEVKDHSPEAFQRQLHESGALLGTRLDIYQIHSVTPDSPALTDPVLHRKLAELGRRGVLVGLSTSGPRQGDVIRAALDLKVDGQWLFHTVQATWNLLETSVAGALADADAAGLLVILKETLANGRLADPARSGRAHTELRQIAEDTGATCDAVALAAALHQPWAHIVLSGAATSAQLTSNLRAATIQLTPRQLDYLVHLAMPPDTYWTNRSQLAWT